MLNPSAPYFPILKMPPWFPGQLGVPGSDSPLGARYATGAVVIYVDENNSLASDNNDGTDPMYPKSTIASAVASTILTTGSVIMVASEATIVENVIVPSTAPKNVTIMGCIDGSFQPTWTAATGVCLTLRQQSWRVCGFHFIGPADDTGTCIRVEWDGTDTINASFALIDHNVFDGQWSGKYGIVHWGSPYNVRVLENMFMEFKHGDATGFAIYGAVAPTANALEWVIAGNTFWLNENHIGSLANDNGFNCSLIANNFFHAGANAGLIQTVLKLDTRGGSTGENLVVGNILPGDYSNVGGYYGSGATADIWIGNYTNDVAEAEASAVGLTILPPA